MYPFRNILFPTDFSAHARAALKYASAFARSGHGRVVVLSVQNTKVPENLLTLPEEFFGEQENRWLSQLCSEARELLSDPLLAGLEVELVIVQGEPASEITCAVQDYDIDLVTIVTHGRKGLSRALGGSTAEEIIAEALCPVLAVRPPQHDFVQDFEGQAKLHLNRVVLATNFRPSSAAATQLATQITNNSGAELHALYVIGDYFEQFSAIFPDGPVAALSRLRNQVQQRLSQLGRNDGPRANTHVAEGRPYEEIVRLAGEKSADMIVIGTTVHNSLFGGAPVLGSEIERVVRNAPCPVLCVPSARVLTQLPAFVSQPVTT